MMIDTNNLYRTLGTCHPKLTRGQVWCLTCGATAKVDSGTALRSGWPKCCGFTMSLDSPDERAAWEQARRMR